MTGATVSGNFPTRHAVQSTIGGPIGLTVGLGFLSRGFDAFVTKLDARGALAYSTYLGGSGFDVGTGIAVDGGGNVSISGVTTSNDFPIVHALQDNHGALPSWITISGTTIWTGFAARIDSTGSPLVYSTWLGGFAGSPVIALDGRGTAYFTGVSSPVDAPAPAQFGGAALLVTIEALPADLAVSLAEDADGMTSSTRRYVARVTNSGPDPAAGVVLSVTVSAGTLVLMTSSQGQCSVADLSCALGTLDARGDATVAYSVTRADATTLQTSVRVSAMEADPNPANNSATVRSAVFNRPTALTAADRVIDVVVKWTDNSGIETGFEVERKPLGGAFAKIATVHPNVTTFYDRTARRNQPYTYRVRAVAAALASSYSDEASVVFRPAPALVVPQTVAFGDVTIGGAKTRTFTLTNIGYAPLTGTVSAPVGALTVTSGSGSYTLAPGMGRTVTVQFRPTAALASSARILVRSNDPKHPAANVSVSGRGR